MKITCAHCGTAAEKPGNLIRRNMARYGRVYCSRECSYAARRTGRKALGWHEARFVPDPNKVNIICPECETPFWLPPSKITNNIRCSDACKVLYAQRLKEARQRTCEKCGRTFVARTTQISAGAGRFCSHKCTRADKPRAQWKIPNRIKVVIGTAQRWRCAICRKNIKQNFHVDHIIPLARGGANAPSNLQLLCPRCNASKGARDPIEHMQKMGRLL